MATRSSSNDSQSSEPSGTVLLFGNGTGALAMIDARTGDYALLVERICSKLDEIGANDFEVEGPECPFGEGRLWIGIYSIAGATQKRWAAYVSSRRQAYHQTLSRVSEEQDLLALAGPTVLIPQIEECRTISWPS
jgi:hypothetical protein